MDEWVNALGAQEEQDRSPVGEHTYLCIDLKTFYASVECADRGLDPFTSRLVVADPSRGRSTICLAITPALKELGIRNRCRVFEIPRADPCHHHHGAAAHAPLHGGFRPNLRHLPRVL